MPVLASDVCEHVVVLTTSSVRGDPIHLQNNKQIVEWNAAMEDAIGRAHPETIIIDVYPKSIATKHGDNVHHITSYYKELGTLFS